MSEAVKKIPQKKITTTIRMDPDLHAAMSKVVYRLGEDLPPRKRPTMDRFIAEAITEKLGGGGVPSGVSVSVESTTEHPPSTAHRKWLDKLRYVLASGDKDAIRSVTSILDVFEERVRIKERQGKQ